MKNKGQIFIGFALGICIAGSISLFSMPFWLGKGSFVMGFMAGLLFLICIMMAIFIWNRDIVLHGKQTGDDHALADTKQARYYTLRRMMFSVLLIAGSVCISLFLYHQQALQKLKWKEQQTQVEHRTALIESNRTGGLINLMNNLLDRMDAELAQSPDRTLSEETISRIATLSYSFVSYKPLTDSLSLRRLSPERGQLLLLISGMNIDSSSLKKIISQTSFANALLREADLNRADLRKVDLKNADLKDIQLQGAMLDSADLQSAQLWGAHLNKARLNGAILKTADLKWSMMHEAQLKNADLRGAEMSSAHLLKTDMTGADMQYIDLNGAILNEAILTGAKMNSANLKKAQLEKTQLRDVNLTSAHLNEAILKGADLTGATLSLANMTGADLTDAILANVIVADENWLTRLEEWGVKGAKEIQLKYKIVDQSTPQKVQYRIELKLE